MKFLHLLLAVILLIPTLALAQSATDWVDVGHFYYQLHEPGGVEVYAEMIRTDKTAQDNPDYVFGMVKKVYEDKTEWVTFATNCKKSDYFFMPTTKLPDGSFKDGQPQGPFPDANDPIALQVTNTLCMLAINAGYISY